jgi:hypothetical protein
MWTGVFPAVTTKFTEDDRLDNPEMERCFALQMEAGCDGLIVAGSLGEGPMLSHDEKLEVMATAKKVKLIPGELTGRQKVAVLMMVLGRDVVSKITERLRSFLKAYCCGPAASKYRSSSSPGTSRTSRIE